MEKNELIKISKYLKNSKYPSKYSRDFFPGNWQYWRNLRALPTVSLFSDLWTFSEMGAWRDTKNSFRGSTIVKSLWNSVIQCHYFYCNDVIARYTASRHGWHWRPVTATGMCVWVRIADTVHRIRNLQPCNGRHIDSYNDGGFRRPVPVRADPLTLSGPIYRPLANSASVTQPEVKGKELFRLPLRKLCPQHRLADLQT